MDNNKVFKNTYQKMNQDLSKSKYAPEVYYDAQNVRVISHDRQSLGSVHNVRGNQYYFSIPDVRLRSQNLGTYTYEYTVEGLPRTFVTDKLFSWPEGTLLSDLQVIGYAIIRERIVLYTTNEIDEEPTQSMGVIWEFTPGAKNPLRLLYMEWLNFSVAHPIESIGHYENDQMQKTYWVDGYNELRHINIADPDLPYMQLKFVNVAPNISFDTLSLSEVIKGSGSFTAGRVGYSYNYVNQFGSESKMSPQTPLYNINGSNTGNLVEEAVGISFELTVSNVDTNFDYIRIYRIFYDVPYGEPTITLFIEEPITKSTYTFIDDGTEVISAISVDTWKFIGSDPFVPGTLAVKDNRLFTANHKYTYFDFDFDFRAYRFNASQDAVIFEDGDVMADPATGVAIPSNGLTVTSANWSTVPTTHDCINPSVKAETDSNNNTDVHTRLSDPTGDYWKQEDPYYDEFVYQEDGTTLGAEGPYVKLTVTTPTLSAQTDSNYLKYPDADSFLDTMNVTTIGLKRDETYRIGIECLNDRGQWTFPYWICDFRIPSANTKKLIDNATGDFYQVQLEFELKTAAISLLQAEGVVGFRIVRVERTKANRTVRAQGMLGPTIGNFSSGTGYAGLDHCPPPHLGTFGYNPIIGSLPGVTPGQIPYHFQTAGPVNVVANSSSQAVTEFSRYVVEFRSPDVNQETPTSGYFIVHTAVLCEVPHTVHEKNSGGLIDSSYLRWFEETDDTHYRLDSSQRCFGIQSAGIIRLQPFNTANILNFDRLDNAVGVINDGINTPISMPNQWAIAFRAGKHAHSICNHGLYTKIGDDSNNEYLDDQLGTTVFVYNEVDITNFILMADFKQYLPNQYGGNTYADRTRNTYIPSSEYSTLSTSAVTVYGDTVTTNMRFQRSQWKYENGFATDEKSHVRDMYMMPCEMEVNDDLRVSANIAFSGDNANPDPRFQTTIDEFHQYNDIYHYPDRLDPKPAKPLDYRYAEIFDNEVRYSDEKTLNENFDSWTTFRTGNANNVSGVYGPIERIINNGDILYFWQYYGYGLWEVNPDKAVSTEDGSSLEIGTGGVLHRYRYISTNIGCQHKWSISAGPFGVTWWDQVNKKLQHLSKKQEELNLKGINTWLQNTRSYGNNPILHDGVNATFYQHTNETYITFHTPDEDGTNHTATTWVYSHPANGFVGRFTTAPTVYIPSYGALYMSAGLYSRDLYQMDAGERGVFEQTTYPAYVTIVLNGVPDIVKLLDNLEWNSECYNSDGDEESLLTFTHIRIWNDFQDTGLVELNSNNSNRLMRVWRYTVPTINVVERVRSQYHFVQLYLDNADNREVVIHDLISHCRLQSL